MNGPKGQERKEGVCGKVNCFNEQPLNVKIALIIIVQNIFPHTLTYYHMATLNILVQMKVLNAIWIGVTRSRITKQIVFDALALKKET